MDRKSPEISQIQCLIEHSAAARSCLGREVSVLRQRLDLPARLCASLKDHPSAWLLGSLASGFAARFLWRRKPAPPQKIRTLPATLLGLTWTAARPWIQSWLADQLKLWLAGPAAHSLAGRFLTRPSPTSKSL